MDGKRGARGVAGIILISVVLILSGPEISFGGDLEPTAAPGAQGTYTLQDLYDRLDTGAAGSLSTATAPSAAPADSRPTVNEVMGKAPAADGNGAVASDVVEGKTFWGLTAGEWGPRTGSLSAQTIDNTKPDQPGGVYGAFDLSTIDTDLTAGNISKDVNIYGVVGTAHEASGDATAADVLSGKTFSNDSATGVSGTMTDNGAVSIDPGTTAKTIPAGYHNGSGTVAGDADLSTGNILKDVDIFGVVGTALEASGDATAADVLSGKTFSNDSATGVSGTMTDNGAVNITPGTTAKTIPAGYHNGSGTVDGDADLASGNIRNTVNIFGIDGDSNVVDTSSGDAVAADIASGKVAWVDGSEITGTSTCCDEAQVPKTGQTTSYNANDDGDLEKGLALPSPRFTDNNDGTVTDNLTKLVWLKNATCVTRAWTTAIVFANNLYDGYDMPGPGTDCDLSDGSSAGDWRLPNIKELLSLINYEYYAPALSNEQGVAQWTDGDPFTNVESGDTDLYWSSTTWMNNTGAAWGMKMAGGATGAEEKANTYYVWPVRDGQ